MNVNSALEIIKLLLLLLLLLLMLIWRLDNRHQQLHLEHREQSEKSSFSFIISPCSLKENFGGVFSLKLGSYNFVMASTTDAVKEVLVKKSADYAGRPQMHVFYTSTLGMLHGRFCSLRAKAGEENGKPVRMAFDFLMSALSMCQDTVQ